MKLQNTILASALAVLALSSCGKDNEFDGHVEPSNAIEFTSSIAGGDAETRLDGTSWAGGEAVGVFMLDASTSAFTISDNGANKEYVGQENGGLTPKGSALTFPSDNSEVRFVAYYPYQKSADAGTYTIDLSKEGDNDLLFASAPTAYNAVSEGKVSLAFAHKLSKMQLTLATDITGEPIDASKVTMRAEMRTAGTFSLKTQAGELTIGEAVKEVAVPVVAVSGKAVGSVIVFPTVQASNGTSTTTLNSVSKLIFDVDGKEYICDDATMLENLMSNNQYNYDVVLSEDAKAIVSLTSTIQAWAVVDKGSLIATPTDGDDSGNQGGNQGENLGNVTEARALITSTDEVEVTEDFVLRGSVISKSKAVANPAVVISDGKAGILLYGTDGAGLSVGDEVTVPLKGSFAQNYNGLLEFKSKQEGAFQFVFTKVGTREIAPIKVTNVADLANYISMLVTLDNVSVKSDETATTWEGITEEGKQYPNGKVHLMVGSQEVLAKHNYNAPFYKNALPTGTGTVTAIVGYYKDAAQLAFRSEADFAGMNGTGGDTGNTGDENLGNVTEARALVTSTDEVEVTADFTLRGSVISKSKAVANPAVVISDGKAGILLYGTDGAGLTVGDEVTVPLKGSFAQNYNGLLEFKSKKDGPFQFVFTKVGTREIAPIKVTNVADLANYISMLVTLDNVSVKSDETATTWEGITEEGKQYPNGKVHLMVGNQEVLAKHNYNAPFYKNALPTGTGTVTAIVGYYKDAAQLAFRSEADFAGMNGTGGDTGNTGGDTGNTGGDTGNTGGDTGNTGGDTGSTSDVVTFPVTFDFTADASNGSGVYPGSGANSIATLKTYGAAAFTYTPGTTFPGYIVAKGFTADSGWDFTLPVKNLAAGAKVNFVGTMKSSNTAPGKYEIKYSVDGGTNFVSTSTIIELAGTKDYHKINEDITIAEGLASGNLIIRFAVSGTICAGRVADSTYKTENFVETGTNRWADGAVTISLK